MQGYLRKGQALHKLKRYRDAMEAYTEGLKVNSADQSLMRAAQGLRPILMQQQQQQQQSMFTKLFSPQNIAMLKQHPQTAPLFADGTMDKKLELVSESTWMCNLFFFFFFTPLSMTQILFFFSNSLTCLHANSCCIPNCTIQSILVLFCRVAAAIAVCHTPTAYCYASSIIHRSLRIRK